MTSKETLRFYCAYTVILILEFMHAIFYFFLCNSNFFFLINEIFCVIIIYKSAYNYKSNLFHLTLLKKLAQQCRLSAPLKGDPIIIVQDLQYMQ